MTAGARRCAARAAGPARGQAGQHRTGGRGLQKLPPGRLHVIPFPKKIGAVPSGDRRRRRTPGLPQHRSWTYLSNAYAMGRAPARGSVTSCRIRSRWGVPTSWAARESRSKARSDYFAVSEARRGWTRCRRRPCARGCACDAQGVAACGDSPPARPRESA